MRLYLGRRREAAHSLVLGIERLEYRQQLRNGQQIGDPLPQVEELEAAALTADRRIGAYDLAETGAVDVRHVGEVEDDLLVALVDEAVDLVLQQLIALAHGDPAL